MVWDALYVRYSCPNCWTKLTEFFENPWVIGIPGVTLANLILKLFEIPQTIHDNSAKIMTKRG